MCWMSAPFKAFTALCSVSLMAMGATAWAMAPQGGGLPRRAGSGNAARFKVLPPAARQELRKPSASLGSTGLSASEAPKAFSPERALAAVNRVQSLARSAALDGDALKQARDWADFLGREISRHEGATLTPGVARALAMHEKQLENLEGLALKGSRRCATYRFPMPTPLPEGLRPRGGLVGSSPNGGTSKTNTGWILDQHVFDPEGDKIYPTLISDFRHYDEGQNDIAIGHSDHPTANSMFGWVWQVQSFYWTDTTLVTDHANPSYCLLVQVSYDGGYTWLLYEMLYDPSGAGHTTSLDLINPKLAMDVTGTHDRFYVAYEYVKSATDHDVYVYSETSVLDDPGADANPQDIAVGISANMERNPAIASDYRTDEVSYRVVAYEYAYSAMDYDLYAAQSTGDGSTWTLPVAVAETAGMETHPALSAGCTGDGGAAPYSAYMHLAYNYETWGTGTSQVLSNPGFESGHADWFESRGTIIDNSPTYPARTGSYKAWLGGSNNANDALYQTVAIPADATSAQLSFFLKMASTEGTTTAYDYLYIRVRDTAGTLLTTLGALTNKNKASYANYTSVSYSLNPYIGQEVRVCLEATTDSSEVTSFLVDDTALDVGGPQLAEAEIRYKQAPYPGATAYPDGLAVSSPLTVLASTGDSPAWPYGPPAIAASHGGSETVPGGRVIVAADQLFPEGAPAAGDPERYQLVYAVSMCNGGDTCGDIEGCTPAVSLGWNAYYLDDNTADYRFPSLVVDGVGWVEGTSGIPQNGVAVWPEIFMAYYYRELQSSSDYGAVQMLLADASDERCTGFASGAWYLLTAAPRASDDDDRVVAKQGAIAAFNYFYGWPGVCFDKRLNHFGASMNDDVYYTTLGDNYVIDTLAGGTHIDAWWDFYGTSYVGPWTYPWPAGYQMTLTADATANDNGHDYVFSTWSTGVKDAALTVLTDYCGYAGSCPETTIDALYNEVGAGPLRVPYSATPTRVTTAAHGNDLTVTWDAGNCASANYHLLYGKGENLASWAVDGGVCALGASGTSTWAGVPDPSAYASHFLWFLVVGDNGAGTEGSWGLTYPGGFEEGGTGASNVCGMTVKDLSGTCGTP